MYVYKFRDRVFKFIEFIHAMASKRVTNNGLHIPMELMEKVLLNLPVKSLLRFSAVSKSWNRMIKSPEFRKRYRGRQMMVLRVYSSSDEQKALACPLSLSSLSIANATPFVLPFTAEPYSDVSCGELRCVESENSLCLYNPSTRAYRKLPTPSCPPEIGRYVTEYPISVYVYGLGYDSSADDYKVIKILRDFSGNGEVYSLQSDCWRELSDSRREIQSCMPGNGNGRRIALTPRGVFVDGALHWLVDVHWRSEDGNIFITEIAILSFDVSTEKFGEVAAPESIRRSDHWLDVCVLRGRLCVCVNRQRRFVVWEYDNNNGWSKDLEIDYSNIYPLCYARRLQPLYFYGDDGNLVRAVTCCTDIGKIFIHKLNEDGESSLVESKFGGGYGILDSFTYVESLVSPFPLFPSKEEGGEKKRGRVEGWLGVVKDLWAPWRGKYPEPTSGEFSLIRHFLSDIKLNDDDNESGMRDIPVGCPNSRSRITKFIRQVLESKGYNVDEHIDVLVSSGWKSKVTFIPHNLNDEKIYNEAMAATKVAIGEINDQMRDKRYELRSVDKLVTAGNGDLLLTFTAKEIGTQDLETFQAMLIYAKTYPHPSTLKLLEWKFKPLPIHKI